MLIECKNAASKPIKSMVAPATCAPLSNRLAANKNQIQRAGDKRRQKDVTTRMASPPDGHSQPMPTTKKKAEKSQKEMAPVKMRVDQFAGLHNR